MTQLKTIIKENKKMSDSDLVPLMYRAQIEDRGKIQYAGDAKPATKWVNQWLDGCPPNANSQENNANIRQAALQRTPQRRGNFTYKMPQFATGERTWEQPYTISWRLVTNSGQDEDVIRPVIGAKGIPFYPGSSMKGVFLRACLQIAPDKVLDFCGGEVEEIIAGKKLKRTKPGILRFHGGYPVDMSWGKDRERLARISHKQCDSYGALRYRNLYNPYRETVSGIFHEVDF
jgi:CRISPR-associated protein Cmr6